MLYDFIFIYIWCIREEFILVCMDLGRFQVVLAGKIVDLFDLVRFENKNYIPGWK